MKASASTVLMGLVLMIVGTVLTAPKLIPTAGLVGGINVAHVRAGSDSMLRALPACLVLTSMTTAVHVMLMSATIALQGSA